VTQEQVRALLLKRAARYAKRKGSSGVTGWCLAHGVSKGHASEFINNLRPPTTDILDALGLVRSYSRKPKLGEPA